jgi:uncharacterized protein (DUF3820 family)
MDLLFNWKHKNGLQNEIPAESQILLLNTYFWNMDRQILLDLVSKKMPFGKYKGKLLCDIPEDYLIWMHRKGFPEGKLGMWLSTLYEIRLNGLEEILRELKKINRPQ